jgi:sulfur-oxidizing protein SoxY
MTLSRRKFFTTLGKTAGYIAVVASLPQLAWAKWNEKAFTATNLDAAIKAKYGDLAIVDGTEVNLKAPAIAENGAVVPIKVKTNLANVKSISLFVKDNPSPLVTTLHIGKNTLADIQIRIRMGKTSEITALVEADGKLYRATQEVKVTIGGCGG